MANQRIIYQTKVIYGFGNNNILLYGLDQLDDHTLQNFDDEFFLILKTFIKSRYL
jgi:hypothetical protein